MLEKGILIFALGHPYYGKYAYNLCVSIKAVENFPVALVFDQTAISHLDESQQELFDQLIHAPHLKPGCGVKLTAYDLSPFERTLVLDADMLWLPEQKPSDLFTSLYGHSFTAISEGDTDNPSGEYFFWGNVDEIREKYKVDKIHQWRTEVMYFEMDAVSMKIFSDAQDIHKKHGLDYVKPFAEGIPDELGINIACAISQVEPHEKNWKPSYWPSMHANRVPEFSNLYRDYYLLSIGGNHITENVKQLYNSLMKAQAPKLGLQHGFPAESKHLFLPERRKS